MRRNSADSCRMYTRHISYTSDILVMISYGLYINHETELGRLLQDVHQWLQLHLRALHHLGVNVVTLKRKPENKTKGVRRLEGWKAEMLEGWKPARLPGLQACKLVHGAARLKGFRVLGLHCCKAGRHQRLQGWKAAGLLRCSAWKAVNRAAGLLLLAGLQVCRSAGLQCWRSAEMEVFRAAVLELCRDGGLRGCRDGGLQGCRESGLWGSKVARLMLQTRCDTVRGMCLSFGG